MKRKNAFTLIELIAVLVILAILALIVTPLVLNIVRNAKESANKRSVDAYGKSIELAVATYLLDNGNFPTGIDDLKIEYKGSEVVCKVQQLNEDSSIYLSECTVGGKEVKDSSNEDGWYHYGTNNSQYDYKIGDIITYNGMNFYVIENSYKNSETVTVLKEEPLTVDEISTYGEGHINRYTYSSFASAGTVYDYNGYGGMAYYSSETCSPSNSDGCTIDYSQSEVKYAVDAWAADKLNSSDLKVDSTGYSVRLITYDELLNNLGYEDSIVCTLGCYYTGLLENVPNFVYNSNYSYFTMSQNNDSTSLVWKVYKDGLHYTTVDSYGGGVVRPVVTLNKSAL